MEEEERFYWRRGIGWVGVGGEFLDSLSRSWWSGALCCVTDRQISSFLFLVDHDDLGNFGIPI